MSFLKKKKKNGGGGGRGRMSLHTLDFQRPSSTTESCNKQFDVCNLCRKLTVAKILRQDPEVKISVCCPKRMG